MKLWQAKELDDAVALTKRQQQCLIGAALSKTRGELAAELGISVKGIEQHFVNLGRKLGLAGSDYAGFARYAIAHKLIRLSAVGLLGVFLAFRALAVDVILAWDANADDMPVGYLVYYGAGSRSYTNTVDAGTNLSCTVSNLVDGPRYFFAVTATSLQTGLESDFSSEAYWPAWPTWRNASMGVTKARVGKVTIRSGP